MWQSVLSCLCDCHGLVLDMLHSASDPHGEQPDEAMTLWLWLCFDILGFFPLPSKHILNEQVCTNHQKSLLYHQTKKMEKLIQETHLQATLSKQQNNDEETKRKSSTLR